MAVPMREATRTLLRELIGVYSCSWSSVVAVACIIFSYFWLTNSHITHSKSDISMCNKSRKWSKPGKRG
ncbi:hypothetical protein FA041_24080 [Escherichia coli]|nr:hypothetical protein [Escherichia coli]